MKPYKVYLHTKSGEYPPKDKACKGENVIFEFGYGATWWPVEKQIWKKLFICLWGLSQGTTAPSFKRIQ